ncbi:LOW QUALITY PROTEIN: Hypothetical protein PHPALM_15673 [Phytophthora palmivora]|uniref:Enoyl reductase (ER) domain-containing protein n=1 Tax=Phytophthora palmivora TaxID=4796 RepID=A0A2P4XRQ3_9STRA|nr:LOW QUALITY PROTEIN: Hypothetical protein PHPALM_15673 [Phytophthora palmivora]
MSTIPAFKVYKYESFGEGPLKEIKFNLKADQKSLRGGKVHVKVFSAALNLIDYKMFQYSPALVSTKPTPEKPFLLKLAKLLSLAAMSMTSRSVMRWYAMPWLDAIGSFGEYINVDTKFLAPKPTNMSWNEAAGVPLAGQTSWQAIHTYGKLQKGQRVLILGESMCLIAKAVGAEVITTCSHRNVELVKSLGADQVIDYTKEKWSDVLGEHSVNLIYDCGYDDPEGEKTGIFVTILSVDKPIDSPIGATLHQIINAPCTEFLLKLKKLIEADKLKTIIGSVHPLENVPDAVKIYMSHRTKGKIIIEVAKH